MISKTEINYYNIYPPQDQYDLLSEDEKYHANIKLLELLEHDYNGKQEILRKIEPKLVDFKWKHDLADAILLIMDVTKEKVWLSAEHDTIWFGSESSIDLGKIDRLLFLKLLFMDHLYDGEAWETFV
jgi:hypothetical protein